MKPDIHPDYHPVVFQDTTTGQAFLTRSTLTSSRTIEWETPGGKRTYPLIFGGGVLRLAPFLDRKATCTGFGRAGRKIPPPLRGTLALVHCDGTGLCRRGRRS